MHNESFFGSIKVRSADKQHLVNKVFKSVSRKYDLMNDVMSFGIHRAWKDAMVENIEQLDRKIIDIAGGTGDIPMRLYKKAVSLGITPDITIADINPNMLKEGQRKFNNKGIFSNINWVCLNAECLPFISNSYSYYTCSFGIRNVTNIASALSEAYRVLKPGGKFVCLEFSEIPNATFSKLYQKYSHFFIPAFGKFIANDEDSYRYLVESIEKFPNQIEFASMIKNAGFSSVSYKNLSGGICAIHTAYKI